jgi:superfamily II DNA or RNA helicase
MIQPYPHQAKSIDEIFQKFQVNQRVLYQLPTGGGKTFVFSFLTKKWVEKTNKKVLILCHRIELVNQTIASLNEIGLTCEAITSKTKALNHKSDVYVGMVQTINNRLNDDCAYFKDVDLVICDECHWLIFDKVFKFFPFAKILGVTATPVVLKKITFYKCQHCKTKYDELTECCNDEVIEWTRPFTMSEIYQDIVVGASIQDLINDGKLVQEISFVKNYTDTSKLKIDSKSGDFSEASMNDAYNDENALFNVVLNYKEICEGKKTIVFNSTTKSNLLVYNKFKEAGYNVKLSDSVNESENRESVVNWFKNTPDAILCNVAQFTTGFDVTDVEAIILNRPTNSLSLFLQMVGRGGRSTTKIYKDSFILIDGGNNIERHNEWSDSTRDWKKIFFGGLDKEKEKAKKIELDNLQICENDECGAYFPKAIDVCPECNTEVLRKKREINKTESDLVTEPIKKIPPPNAEKIYLYTLSQNEDLNFAWRILINKIFDLFIYYRVPKEKYLSALNSGELDKKIKKMVTQCYFVLKSKNDLNSGVERTIQYLVNKVKTKLENKYGQ